MDWVRDLHDKAGKATPGPWYSEKGPWWNEDDGGYLGWFVLQSKEQEICDTGRFRKRAREDAEFIAACSPERVRALCEIAEAAQAYANDPQVLTWDRLGAALASLEPAREEET